MTRVRVTIGTMLGVLAVAGVATGAVGDTTRVSVANDGSESATGGFRGVTSGNGRFVLFVSNQPLAGVPTGGVNQLYVRDRRDGRTRLVSATPAGVAANAAVNDGDFFNPYVDMTPDGRYVAFGSPATNLVADDANGFADVFRKDMVTGAVELVSVSTAGAQANANVIGDPSISADGSRVAFNTGTATNLFADVNADTDIALRDLAARTTARLSETAAGVPANNFSERPAISADGSRVVFETGATNLYTNDANATNDIMAKTIAGGAIVPAAVVTGAPAEGATVLGGNMPDVSGDGRFVVFNSSGVLDPATDANGATDVYRRDLVTGTTTVMSAVNGTPTASNQGGSFGSIDASGDRVAFASNSTNLVSGDGNASNDVFVRTVSAASTARASVRTDGSELNVGAETPSLSGDGAVAVFTGQGQYVPESGADDDVFTKEFAPADATGPAIDATVTVQGANTLRVAGRITDPSGIGFATVGTAGVRPAADGSFAFAVTGTTRLGGPPTAVAITAMDGAGNVSNRTLTFTPAKLLMTSLKVRRVGRVVTLRLGIDRRATVTTTLQRRTLRNGKLVWGNVTKPKARTLLRGTRIVVATLPRARRGVYRVRLLAKRGADQQTILRTFRIR